MTVSRSSVVRISAGDLRPDLMHFTSEEAHEILLSAPGLLPGYRDQAVIAREPWRTFSVQRATTGSEAILAAFIQALDELPHTNDWEQRILGWLNAIDLGKYGFRYWRRAPLFTRLISRAGKSLVFSGPIHRQLDDVCHELRIELSGAEHDRAAAWFSSCYTEADDVTSQVADCLRNSWAGSPISPQDAYFKVLSEYFSEVLRGLDSDVEDNPLLEHLTEFQSEAYQYAKNILRRYGGVFLADVVGLGKTFIAMALISHLRTHYGESAVVIAPPKVLPAWQELAQEFRIELATVSIGKLNELHRHTDRQVLVIDESHNFRNLGTDRYETLSAWLRPGGTASNRKVILLSATPQNSDPLDVKSQLDLFPDNYTRLPFEGESLDSWFKEVRARRESIVSLLQHVVVRRTRGYVRRAYPDAVLRRRVAPGTYTEEPLRFPERKSGPEQCLRYSIAATYHGGLYDQILETLASLNYPLHGLGAYVQPSRADDPAVRGLRRAGQALRGLYKVLLLKRLESSVHAFRLTLLRLIAKLEQARDDIKNGKVCVSRGQPSTDDEEEDGTFDGSVELAAHLFVPELARAITEDLSRTRSLEALVRDLGPDEDAKLQTLLSYLSKRDPSQHRTLVFTQFAETAEYLGEYLARAHARAHVVTGSRGGALKAAKRFAPLANGVHVPEGEQIALLISTDVLSEGVNLQDADTLINYDLHWNPVRLIQRAGRIDRIGSQNEEIHIASFLPERELEAGLGLEEVLRRRITDFIRVFGEDSAILPGEETLDETNMADAYTGSALERSDESDEDLDALNTHLNRVLKLRREEPDRFARIVALRPGRYAIGSATTRPVVATRLGWFWKFWSGDSSVLEVDALRGLQLFHEHAEFDVAPASPSGSEPRLRLIQAAREAFEPMATTFRSRREHPKLSAGEAHVLDQLEEYRRTCLETRRALVSELIEWVKEGRGQLLLPRRGRAWKKEKLPAEVVFNELRLLAASHAGPLETLGDARVVASSFGRDFG